MLSLPFLLSLSQCMRAARECSILVGIVVVEEEEERDVGREAQDQEVHLIIIQRPSSFPSSSSSYYYYYTTPIFPGFILGSVGGWIAQKEEEGFFSCVRCARAIERQIEEQKNNIRNFRRPGLNM